MNLQTPVELPTTLPPICHTNELMLIGSCFTENIGALLKADKFNCHINPFGILYNPASIATALRQLTEGKQYTAADLIYHRGQYHSLMHHSTFSSPTEEECLTAINTRLQHVYQRITRIDRLLITFGTAWIYTHHPTGHPVSNCHKLPDHHFTRRRLTTDEITATYLPLIRQLTTLNPHLQLIFTISPIRHTKDGMHGNALSKATLLLAVDQLQTHFPAQVHYFPAYELMTDQLRDYRFYADDMLHPTPLATQYIYQRLADACFSTPTRELIKECQTIQKALQHKPFQSESEDHKHFLNQLSLKIKQLTEKHPNVDLDLNLNLTIASKLCRTPSKP